MFSYRACLDQTISYSEAFNVRDLGRISDLLDDAVISSSQRREGLKVGKKSVLSRLKKLWALADKKQVNVEARLGMIDLEGVPSHPCLLVCIDEKPKAVVVFEVGKRDKIYLLSALTSNFMVSKVRLTEQAELLLTKKIQTPLVYAS